MNVKKTVIIIACIIIAAALTTVLVIGLAGGFGKKPAVDNDTGDFGDTAAPADPDTDDEYVGGLETDDRDEPISEDDEDTHAPQTSERDTEKETESEADSETSRKDDTSKAPDTSKVPDSSKIPDESKDSESTSTPSSSDTSSDTILPSDDKEVETTGNTTEKPDPPTKPEPMTYEEYMALSPAEQQEYFLSFSDINDYFAWYNDALAKYEETKEEIIVDGSIDISDYIDGNN